MSSYREPERRLASGWESGTVSPVEWFPEIADRNPWRVGSDGAFTVN
jgi:hypothetical protein